MACSAYQLFAVQVFLNDRNIWLGFTGFTAAVRDFVSYSLVHKVFFSLLRSLSGICGKSCFISARVSSPVSPDMFSSRIIMSKCRSFALTPRASRPLLAVSTVSNSLDAGT